MIFKSSLFVSKVKAMNQSHQGSTERDFIRSPEKLVSPSHTSYSSLEQAVPNQGCSLGNAAAGRRGIALGLHEKRLPIQQVFYSSQISDTYVEVYNREMLARLDYLSLPPSPVLLR